VNFNKIVLNACRAEAGQRYQTAEELLTAVVSFQFSRYDPRKEKALGHLLKLVSVGGLLTAAIVIILLVWRLVWLLKQEQ
jgi:hypothetical protein